MGRFEINIYQFIAILVLITLNTFLFLLPEEQIKEKEVNEQFIIPSDVIFDDEVELFGKKTFSERIDSLLILKNFRESWIKNKFYDTLTVKTLKVPSNTSLMEYNSIISSVLRNFGMENPVAIEDEDRQTLKFEYTTEDGILGRINLKIDQRSDEMFFPNTKLCIIFSGFGDEWGGRYVQDILASELPFTIGIIPGQWASKNTKEACIEYKKDYYIQMPMEPFRGSIEREEYKILLDSDTLQIKNLLLEVYEEYPELSGYGVYKGSAVLSDDTLTANVVSYVSGYGDYFIALKDSFDLNLINFKEQTKFHFVKPDITIGRLSEADEVVALFESARDMMISGQDVILDVELSPVTGATILEIIEKKYYGLPFVSLKEYLGNSTNE